MLVVVYALFLVPGYRGGDRELAPFRQRLWILFPDFLEQGKCPGHVVMALNQRRVQVLFYIRVLGEPGVDRLVIVAVRLLHVGLVISLESLRKRSTHLLVRFALE